MLESSILLRSHLAANSVNLDLCGRVRSDSHQMCVLVRRHASCLSYLEYRGLHLQNEVHFIVQGTPCLHHKNQTQKGQCLFHVVLVYQNKSLQMNWEMNYLWLTC